MGNILNYIDVSVLYGENAALTNVNIEFGKSDFVGIIGPNGGGKTSFIKAALGLVPYTGKIYRHPEIQANTGSIGYLPQINNFDRSFPITVKEIVYSGLQEGRKNFRINSKHKNSAMELLELTGISALSEKTIAELSGGELQRTLLCRALISNPKLLILDEPATYIDSKFERELYEILKSLNDRMAILMVSHNLTAISKYVKSVVCVNKTVHRHDISEITDELLESYNCPIQHIA